MAKTKISEFSPTPANNTDIDNINIAEGCAPSGINDAIRELMAQLKDFQAGTAGDSFNGPIGTTTAVTGAFTNVTASGTLGVTGVATLGNGAVLGTPASVTLTNGTGLPISTGVSGLGTGVATALAVNVGSAGAPVINGGALGTPSSGTVTNLTGTASININGTVGATTPTTGAFTTLTTSSTVTLNGGTANGVAYLNGSKVLTTGSALTFDGAGVLTVSSAVAQMNLTPTTNTNNALYRATNAGGTAFIGLDSSAGALGAAYGLSLYHTGNYPIVFSTNGSEQMRLTSTGLGIGTSSPTGKLHVSGTGYSIFTGSASSQTPNTTGLSIGYNRSGANGETSLVWGAPASGFNFEICSFVSSTITPRLTIDTSGNLGLGVTPSGWSSEFRVMQVGLGGTFYGRTVAGDGDKVGMSANVYKNTSFVDTYITTDSASKYDQAGGSHIWYTAPSGTAGDAISFSQVMTLDASGNLILGNTSNTSYGTVRAYIESAGSTAAIKTTGGASSVPLGIWNTASSGTINLVTFFYSSGLTAGSITTDGTTTSYNTSSDYRLKNITGPITTSGAYIDSLNPVEGTWKADGSTFVGLIAHEVQEASRTNVATGVKDGEQMQGMDYSSAEIIANLIAEVKSLRQRLAAAGI